MKSKWMLKNIKVNLKKMSQDLNVSEVTCKVMVNRGIKDYETAKNYIYPELNSLYNPRLMKDLEKGVTIIKKDIEQKKRIIIIGDYDVDGVISTYLLYKCLRKCGANVSYYIPDRVKEGYGINETIIRNVKDEGFDVIITCDNGISAIEQVKLAKELGMEVIITDHHDIPFIEKEDGCREYVIPSADAIINPKQLDCTYPFKYLCGAGVVLKFVEILYECMEIDKKEVYKLLEYVSIATVCDVVDLKDENRIIVKNGLKQINNTKNIGLKALFEVTGLKDKEINVYSLGFVIGPCINASGRLEQALWALKLLLSEEEKEAENLAKKLYELNKERQELTNAGVEAAIEIIENSNMEDDKVLVIYIEDVHESVAGIIAGRIREKYNLPTFILTKGNNEVKGSGRSIEEYNMFEELLKCKELLGKFGGHPMAAGLSLDMDNIDKLRKKLNEITILTEEDLIPKITLDMQLPLEKISFDLINDLKKLEPFGKGNSKPLFGEKNVTVVSGSILGKNRNVLKLKLIMRNGIYIDGIYFGNIEEFEEIVTNKYGTNELERLYQGCKNKIYLDLIFTPSINEYKGNTNIQVVIQNFR